MTCIDESMTIFKLNSDFIFPDPTQAEPDGLLAIGGDLQIKRILLSYSMGIFPWYSDGQPILWWSPDPRLIILPHSLHRSKSLKRVIKSKKYEVKFDQCFDTIVELCSKVERRGQNGTWITDEMFAAYSKLHKAGFAHSVECYYKGQIVGGLYGVSLGGGFFGESMFSLKSDASKICLATLSEKLLEMNFDFIDCQIPTDHLKRMGAFEIDRKEFLIRLRRTLDKPTYSGNWAPLSSN